MFAFITDILWLSAIRYHYLDEFINFEMLFWDKLCDYSSLQCLPSQSNNVFKTFTDNPGLNLFKIANKNLYLIKNLDLIVVLVDFSVNSSK